jgi:hypothetical protein
MTTATDDSETETGSTDANAFADAVDERDCRALTETMFVRRDAPDLYEVRTASGGEYAVDAREPACTCPDFQYRDVACKHVRRVRLETGDRDVEALATEIDAALDAVDDRIAALAERRAELASLRTALARFENR